MRRPNNSSLNYQPLEDRQLLAGDVTVVESDHLFIRGDQHSNQIAIVADESGVVTITGLNNTTINGGSEPFQVTNVQNLHGERGRNAAFEGGLKIKTFGGDDRIDIRGIELGDESRINTGGGDDFIRMLNSTSNHDLRAITGVGDDSINFVRSRAHGDLNLRTASGHDSIRIHNSRTWGHTDVLSGIGNDSVTFDRVRLTGQRHRILTYHGDDQIVIRNNDLNEMGLKVYAGNGLDHVSAEMHAFNEVAGEVIVAGQGGYNVADMDIADGMGEFLRASGFTNGTNPEGAWFVYDRADALPEPTFNYWASSVRFDATTTIRSIDWLGSYFSSEAPETDNFVIQIHESEAIESVNQDYWFNQPTAEPAAVYEVGNNANRSDTGEEWVDSNDHRESDETGEEGFARKIFSYSADIDFEFLADEMYWISIYAVTDTLPDEHANLTDFDFGVLLDYPGEPGEYREYVPPTGTESDPFENTNAVFFDDNEDAGLDPDRWYFSSSEIRTLFTLNQGVDSD